MRKLRWWYVDVDTGKISKTDDGALRNLATVGKKYARKVRRYIKAGDLDKAYMTANDGITKGHGRW